MIGRANESAITFCGVETKARLDSGSQVTTVSEHLFDSLNPKPPTAEIEELVLKGPDGRSISYLKCIVVTIAAGLFPDKEVDALALVVPTTAYHAEVPIVIGTNAMREYDILCDSDDDIPPEWKTAFVSLQSGFLGSVR